MKYICKEDFKINDILVGTKRDILEITDAIPDKNFNETLEDVKGYCDILNINTNQKYNATWFDVNCNLAIENLSVELVQIILTCPNCRNSTWIRLNAGEFECLSCGNIYDTDDMCSESKEINN